jgi:peroxiredoxin
MSELAAGMKAPEFDLPGSSGQSYGLKNYHGGPLVLYFYPKDDTSGCTVEGLNLQHLKPNLRHSTQKFWVCRLIAPPATTNFAKNMVLALIWPQMKAKPCLRPMVSGLKKACMAKNTWVWNAQHF